MSRARALKFMVMVTGLLFLLGIYPLVMSLWFWQHTDDIVPMFLSLYVTLGVFLLIGARNPSGHRSLIQFTAWSSLAHAGVMLVQSYHDTGGRPELYGMSAILILIGVPLIALAPTQRPVASAAASSA